VGGLIAPTEVPSGQYLFEVNGTIKAGFWGRSKVYGDVSLLSQAGWGFRTADADGNEIEAPVKDAVSLRPLVAINELYALFEMRPELNVVVGKKRVIWGSGLGFNPTDLLNVRRDPTDPNAMRAGAWLAQVEVPLETLTFTALFAPQVLKLANGIPYQWLVYPKWDEKDEEAHYLVAARMGALIADSDVNVMFFYGNRFNDAFEKKFRVGFSFSRNIAEVNEVHLEGLVQSGSARVYVTPECVASAAGALGCVTNRRAFASRALLESKEPYATVLLGGRHTFSDDSMLSLEYLHQGDGLSPAQFQDQVVAMDVLQQATALGLPVAGLPGVAEFAGSPGTSDTVPQRFAFQPTAQHYLFATYQKPRIADDFTAQFVVILNLQDLSSIWTPSLTWSAAEWLNLSIFGFIPLRGADALSVTVPSTQKLTSEFGLMPLNFRIFAEARVFY
jgi:hypothetical protein